MTRLKVTVVGCWHLGSVIGTCLAQAGHEVHLWDQSSQVAQKWNEGRPPIHEPGLSEIAAKLWQKDLFWTSSIEKAVDQSDWIVIAYDTPINNNDELILDSVQEGLQSVLNADFKKTANFFLTAQIPVGMSRKFQQEILKRQPSWQGHVVYQPENLRLGEAIKCFQNPDRAVLGVDNYDLSVVSSGDRTGHRAIVADFQLLTQNFTTPLNVMSLESAEMVKHALNSFLATCVVFANELSEICEEHDANCWDVVASLKQDSRVGPKAFLRPGLGFSGGTLARDVKTLEGLLQKEKNSNFFSLLYDLNVQRNDWVLKKLKSNLGDLKEKKIVLLGLTYKPFTSTVRRSPAFDVAKLLSEQGASCVALDPLADLGELSIEEKAFLPVTLLTSPDEAFTDASAAIVVTEWPQFKEIPWQVIQEKMRFPLVIDCKKLFNAKDLPVGMIHLVPGEPQRELQAPSPRQSENRRDFEKKRSLETDSSLGESKSEVDA